MTDKRSNAEIINDFLVDRQRAYQSVFNMKNAAVQAVLKDLAVFCRAHASTFHPNTHVSAKLDGRREVYLRLLDNLTLPSDELYAKYHGAPLTEENDYGDDFGDSGIDSGGRKRSAKRRSTVIGSGRPDIIDGDLDIAVGGTD